MAYRATEHTENKKAETRARLIKQAKAIVSSQGFRALSISAAASKANIATGTVYRYFPSKADLCIAIFEQATQREIEAVQEASRQLPSASAKIRAALKTFIERAQQNPTLAYALIAEPVDAELEQIRLQYRTTWANTFAKVLKQGMESGEFYDQDEQLSAAALVGAMAEAIIIPLRSQQQTTLKPGNQQNPLICENIMAFCLRAVVKHEAQPT